MSSGEKASPVSSQQARIEVSGLRASVEPPPIAIGTGRVGQLYHGKLRVWKLGNWKTPELELGAGLRGVTALADGSLAAAGDGLACVLRPDAHALVCDKFFGIFPREGRAALFGAADGALILHEGSLVTRFRLNGKEAVRDGSIILQKESSQAVPIGSSAVACSDSSSVKITSSSGARTEWVPQPAAFPLQLAPVHDGVWVSLSDHRVLLISGAKVVQTLPVELRVISISADDKQVAVLTFDDAQSRLHVSLFEPAGKLLWRADLAPPSPPLLDKEPYVILSPFAPIVVVGSAATLQIFDRASGKQVGEAG